MSVCQYSQIQPVVIYIQKHRETQLEPLGCPETAKCWVSLGFLFDMPFMEKVESCVTFQRFGSIRSTQPTGGYGFFLN